MIITSKANSSRDKTGREQYTQYLFIIHHIISLWVHQHTLIDGSDLAKGLYLSNHASDILIDKAAPESFVVDIVRVDTTKSRD